MATILVTGGAGYIGSHTAKALSRSGFEPVTLDNLTNGHRWAVKWGELVVGDLTDTRLIRETLREHDVCAVVHFAANAYVGESMTNPRKYFDNNVAGTLSLLEAALDCGVKHFVFSSSCTTYGIPRSVPISECHPQSPVNPYGESKLFVERVLHWYGVAYDLRWAVLRYFNAAGADPDCEIGEDHDPETHLIPLTMAAALGDRSRIKIFGSDYPTPDGTAIRDYVHVTDLAEAHVRAVNHLLDGGEKLVLNLGTGQGHSVREVIDTVQRVSGRRVPAEEAPRRPGDPAELVADASLAADLLSWRPRHSALEEIAETAWRWEQSRRASQRLE